MLSKMACRVITSIVQQVSAMSNSSVAIQLESLRATFSGRKTEGSCWQHLTQRSMRLLRHSGLPRCRKKNMTLLSSSANCFRSVRLPLGLKGTFYSRSGRVIETHGYVVFIVERNKSADATLSRHDNVQDCSLPGAHARGGARHRTRQ